MEHYTLDQSGSPVLCEDPVECAMLGDHARRVAKDEVEGVLVSTVFLSANHRWDQGPPLLFETMVFGKDTDESQWRYCTREAAQLGHDAVVLAIASGSQPPEDLPES